MQSSDLIFIFGFAAGPLLLTAMAAFLGWLYRRAKLSPVSWEPDRAVAEAASEGPRLSMKDANSVASAPPGSAAAQAREDAFRVNARVRRAHVAAWLVYATLVCSHIVAFTNPAFPWSSRVAAGYAALAPQLLILFWAIRLPMGRRVLIFSLYAAAGLLFLLSFAGPKHAWTVGWDLFKVCALVPIPALLILFIRRNQPFLVLLLAVAVYVAGSGLILGRLLPTEESSGTVIAKPWIVLLGLANITLGFLGARQLLRQPRWSLRAIAAVAGVMGIVLLIRDVAHHNLSLPIAAVCLVAVAVLQVLILWSLFKGLVWLAERRFLTIELFQVHLCWAYLTLYLVVTTMFAHRFYGDRIVVRWGVVLALGLFMVTLHLLLIRIYLSLRSVTTKRLLLLRVFGRPNEHEELLDDLNDTWRRIGAVDLLGASDVASRTLESRMLEAFLLRRSDDYFLRTEEDVDDRVGKRRSAIEGDARYPVDPVFCHGSIWWTAFTRLAATADVVVMMDVRGFTTANAGCVRELEYLLQHPLQRVVLIGDSRSDRRTLYEKARAAGVEEKLIVLDFSRRSNIERRALFELLLKAAYA